MKFYQKNKGFTLIELLVVISIIGLLSSVVLASLSTAREKGRIGAGLKFAGYLDRTSNLGPGSFNLDSVGPSQNSVDNNTGSEDGVPYPTPYPTPLSTDVPVAGMNSSISISDALDRYVSVNLPVFPSNWSVTDSGFIMSAWIKPTALSLQNIIDMGGLYNLSILNSTGVLRFTYYNSSRVSQTLISTTPITAGKWHHVAAKAEVISGNAVVSIYIDGKLAGSGSTASGLYTGNTIDRYFCIGRATTAAGCAIGNEFTGLVDNVRFINYALN